MGGDGVDYVTSTLHHPTDPPCAAQSPGGSTTDIIIQVFLAVFYLTIKLLNLVESHGREKCTLIIKTLSAYERLNEIIYEVTDDGKKGNFVAGGTEVMAYTKLIILDMN